MRLSLKEDVNSLSYFKSNFSKVLKKVRRKGRPMVITQNGQSAGVFMDVDTWESYVRKLNLLRLVNEAEVSLKHSRPLSLEQTEEYFRKKYRL